MNQDNYEYLQKQIKYTGFGDDHAAELKQQIETGNPTFSLQHNAAYGKDEVNVTLNFKRPENSDMYFFNNYLAQLKKGNDADVVNQMFYISNKAENITLKEAYNMLDGRAVHKELSNKEGENYKAWVQLDFKETNVHGNFEVKKYTTNYGYDLEKELAKHPIEELKVPTTKERLMASLERGNRQSVTLGPDRNVFIEAAPKWKSLNFYDEHMKKLMPDQIYTEKVSETGEKQNTAQDAKQSAKKEKKQGADDLEAEPSDKKGKKKSMAV